jgi:7-carboxy-7-deazaguanine synthase
MDIKTPSTKVRTNENLIAKSVQLYAEKMQIKSVIAGRTDFDWIVQFHAKLQAQWKTQNPPERKFPDWVLTPCIPHGEQIDLAAFHQVLQLNLQAGGLFHVVGQQHKWVYGSSQEYV